MKSALFLGATIALLGSSFALLQHPNHDDQLILEGDEPPSHNANLTSPNPERLDVAIAAVIGQPFTLDPTDSTTPANIHDAVLVDSTPLKKWAITYNPYTESLTCKSSSTISSDISTIAPKGFTTIRLYSTDCSILTHLTPLLQTHNLRLILGVHIEDPTFLTALSQLEDILTWAASSPQEKRWSQIELIVIGNEAIFNEYTTAPALSTFILSSRSELRKSGYTGPITTTEPLSILTEHADILCPTLDIPAANIHPFFHSDISAEDAGAYVFAQLEALEDVCPGNLQGKGLNLETGWPRRGMAHGVAVPGQEEQKIAVEGILRASEGRSVIMGFGDDAWKDEGDFGVEGFWGCEGLF